MIWEILNPEVIMRTYQEIIGHETLVSGMDIRNPGQE